jgi:hypothetical protein
MKRENVKPGDWTAYSKMHERYLYRQADYPGKEEETPAGGAATQARKGKKTERAGDEDSGNLPLDI